MLLARPISNGQFHGLGATNHVQELQRNLKELARVTGNAAIDPGSESGVVDDATTRAMTNAWGLVKDQLQTWIFYAVQAALYIGASTTFAKDAVSKYAQPLAAATNLAAAKWAHDHPMPNAGGGDFGPIPQADPWYKTPLGIGGIALAAFVAWKFLFSNSKE